MSVKSFTYFGFFFWLLFPGLLAAQLVDHKPGELIIQLDQEIDARDFAKAHERLNGYATHIQPRKVLVPSLNIWLFSFDEAAISANRLLQEIQKDKRTIAIQYNYWLELRETIPSDPDFTKQWPLLNTGQSSGTPGIDLDIEKAWDLSTGGLTKSGDTIVVCVIDNGIDYNHPDLADNLWINHREIPNDRIDNDQNGYIDDYRGWNAKFNNGDIQFESSGMNIDHGTKTTGIIGAIGNNNLGVAGINWTIKIMTIKVNFLVTGNFTAADAIAAYGYALENRKLYNQTNGEKGAFVVATNASWGIKRGLPENSPVWCSFYDSLGHAGILNVVATENKEDINVELEGDLPARCTSDYIIAVTNADHNGDKVNGAAYGETSIDLAAFGGIDEESAWTTDINGGYDYYAGTSAATPHVTGAIALLYASPCTGINELYKADPAEAANLVKSLILDGTAASPDFSGRTLTGGILNVNNSMQLSVSTCADCIAVTSPKADNTLDTEATLSWNQTASVTQVDLRWRATGTTQWNTASNIQPPYRLDELTGCTSYEVEWNTICDSASLGYVTTYTFRTEGCCEPPSTLNFLATENNRAFGQWNEIFGAESYALRFRAIETDTFLEATARERKFLFDGLTSCTNYEIQIAAICDGQRGAYSKFFPLTTKGCGACLENPYCVPLNVDSELEWIAQVDILEINNNSGSDQGYGDYTSQYSTSLQRGQSTSMILAPGYKDNQSFNEYFSVWIDLDQDGSYSDTELLFTSDTATRVAITPVIIVPLGAKLGSTRMRVGMLNSRDPNNTCPVTFKFGEYEDYCVDIVDEASSTQFTNLTHKFKVFPNPVGQGDLFIETQFPTAIRQLNIELLSNNGRIIRSISTENHPPNYTVTHKLNTSGLSSGIYYIRMRSTGKKHLIQKVIISSN